MFSRLVQATGLSSSRSVGQQGVPLELIRFNSTTQKFECGEEALAVLRKAHGPVGVVAVSGRARQGKSFILNQLLGQSNGFQVGPTVRPCTKGLWMWSAPVERRLHNGSKYHLVLLDTEGIDAYDQTGQYSTQIFSLAVLLSSLFVYNQMGGIDEASLDRLSLVTEMTRHIRVRAGGGGASGDSESELADFTPAFLWLLRDFYLSLEDGGQPVTPRQYLETALRPQPGAGRGVESKNAIRESIKGLFPDRDCFCLVRPVNDEKMLQNLESVPQNQLRPEFTKGLAALTKMIFQKAQPKRLGNQIITGSMLAALAEAYVDAINHGAVPTISTAWQGVAEAECRRAADAAESSYAMAFNEGVGPEEADLDSEHQRCLDLAARAFAEMAIGDEGVQKANDARWREAVGHRFQQFKEKRLANAALAIEQLLNAETAKLSQLARQPETTLETLQQELAHFEAEFGRSAAGPTKWKRHAEFVKETYAGVVRDLAQRAQQRSQQELAQAQSRLSQAATTAQQAEARAAQLQSQAGSLEQRAGAAEAQVAALRQELAQERVARQQHATRITALEAHIQDLSSRKESERAAAEGQAGVRLERQAAAHRAEAARLTAQLTQLQHSLSLAQQQDSTAHAQVESLQRQLASAARDTDAWIGKYQALEAERSAAVMARDEAAAGRESALRAKQDADAKLADLQRQQQEVQAQLARAQAEAVAAAQHATAADAEEGYATPDDDGAAAAEASLDPAKLTVSEIKAWLMDHGEEQQVWDLTTKRAKKAQWVQLMRSTPAFLADA